MNMPDDGYPETLASFAGLAVVSGSLTAVPLAVSGVFLLAAKVNQLHSRLRQVTTERNVARAERDEQTAKNTQLEQRYAALALSKAQSEEKWHGEVYRLDRRYAEAVHERERDNECGVKQRTSLSHALHHLEEAYAQLADELQRVEGKHDAATAQRDMTMKENSALKRENSALKREKSELEQKCEAHEKRNEQLSEHGAELRSQLRVLQEDNYRMAHEQALERQQEGRTPAETLQLYSSCPVTDYAQPPSGSPQSSQYGA